MKIENCVIETQVCDFCNPDHNEKFQKLVSHLIDRNGRWIGVYTKEKYDEYQAIREEFEKDLRKPCFCIFEDVGGYICKEHLIELANRM